MAIKNINQFFGTGAEKQILTTPAKRVEFPLSKETLVFIGDMFDTITYYEDIGAGLASNQIWEDTETAPPAMFIAKTAEGFELFINPTLQGSGPKIKLEEGCLSLKGRSPKLKKRDKNVSVTSMTVDGNYIIEKYTQMVARIIQHENDHLLGIII